jgi:hypothetical protein
MSIAALKATVSRAAAETSPGRIQSHVRDINQGIDEIGQRLADLEKRMKALVGSFVQSEWFMSGISRPLTAHFSML